MGIAGDVLGVVKGVVNGIVDGISKVWSDFTTGAQEISYTELKPPPGYCSPDEVSARLPQGIDDPMIEREYRKQIAQQCSDEKQAELKKEDERKKKQAEATAKNYDNTEGRITYCKGTKGVDRIYCDNVMRNYDKEQQKLIAYILTNYEPSDLRNKAIEAVEEAKSPSLVFKVSIALKIGKLDKDWSKEARLGKPKDDAHNEVGFPGAVNKGLHVGPLGISVTAGPVVPVNKHQIVEDTKKAEKNVKNALDDVKEGEKKVAEEQLNKIIKELSNP
jgi:hypothetical protein